MNILLTGATGNLGSHLLPLLVKRGHQVRCLVRPNNTNRRKITQWHASVKVVWGDISDRTCVENAVKDQDIVIHTAYLIPPAAFERSEEAQAVNIGGLEALIQAASKQVFSPKVLFASTYAVFGPHASSQQELLRTTSPTESTNTYTWQKLRCEEMLQQSGLTWSIYRFADIVPMEAEAQKPTSLMFEIPLQTPMEFIHPDDAARAVCNGLEEADIWGKLWLIGGGASCQTSFEDYMRHNLASMGLEMFPQAAFNPKGVWGTGWLDTHESQARLHYQRHSFDEIIHDATAATAPNKLIMFVMKPFVRRWMLHLSPYL